MKSNCEGALKKRVLVIDDEISVLVLLERILRDAGYEVRIAPSGREGIRSFQQGPWDVVTVDRAMPDLNGEEVTMEIKRLAPNVPVVLITGFPGAVSHPALFHAILSKPFRPSDLLHHLATVLARNAEGHEPAPPSHFAQAAIGNLERACAVE